MGHVVALFANENKALCRIIASSLKTARAKQASSMTNLKSQISNEK